MRAEQRLNPSAKEIEDLKASSEELQQQLALRTAELEAAQKELEDFTYSVSHDLRAPLRAINGFARITLEDFGPHLPEEGRHHLERVQNAAIRMGELIEGLLTLSQVGQRPVKRQAVDTAALAQGLLEDLKAAQNDRQIELRIGKLPTCQADPAMLKQVWAALLANALKFSRDRTPAIIEAGWLRQDGDGVYFVRDNGAGFDMQYSNKLFGVFQRLHRAEEFPGIGMGLAIAQRIIHRHGGRIWADGKVDGGATFYFTIDGKHTL